MQHLPLLVLILGVPSFLLCRSLLGLLREWRWTHVKAVVREPGTGWRSLIGPLVTFDGPAGPVTGRIWYRLRNIGLPPGTALRVAFDPADPSRLEVVNGAWPHVITILAYGTVIGLVVLGLIRP